MPAADSRPSRSAPSCAVVRSIKTARWSVKKGWAGRRALIIQAEVGGERVRSIYDFFEQNSRTAAIARILLSMLCVLLLWQIVSLFVTNRLLLVPPGDVARALVAEAQRGAMWANAVATVTAVGTSF